MLADRLVLLLRSEHPQIFTCPVKPPCPWPNLLRLHRQLQFALREPLWGDYGPRQRVCDHFMDIRQCKVIISRRFPAVCVCVLGVCVVSGSSFVDPSQAEKRRDLFPRWTESAWEDEDRKGDAELHPLTNVSYSPPPRGHFISIKHLGVQKKKKKADRMLA